MIAFVSSESSDETSLLAHTTFLSREVDKGLGQNLGL